MATSGWGAGGGAGSAGGEPSGGSLPESIESGVPGAHSTRDWVRKVQHEMRDPPVQFVRDFVVQDGSRSGRGGSARRRLTGTSVLGDARGYGLRELAQRKERFGL